MPRSVTDLSGRVYGYLRVVERADNRKTKPYWSCLCNCGSTIEVAGHHLNSGTITSCKCKRRLQLEGKVFGKLEVLELSRTEGGHTYWLCACSCGNRKEIAGTSLQKGRTTTCGCKKSEKFVTGTYWAGVRGSAKSRGIDLSIGIKYADGLFEAQQCKCVFTWTLLSFIEGTASLDRIDSSMGYVEGNAQWVHKTLNMMNMNLSDEEFIDWCSAVSDYQRPLT